MLWRIETFREYCCVRRDTIASKERLEIEAKHPSVRDFYDDWGDIHSIGFMSDDSDEWAAWLAERRNMFGIYEIHERTGDAEPLNKGDTCLSIPTGLTDKQLVALFRDFLASSLGILGDGKPKYKLDKSTRVSQMEALAILDREEVWLEIRSDSEDLPDDHPRTDYYKRIAALTMYEKYLRHEWRLNWRTERDSYRVTIDRGFRHYQNCIDKAIDYVFPPIFGR